MLHIQPAFRLVRSGVQLGPLGTAATDWTIVACPGWLWWRRNWWNEDWQGKPKYSEKTRPSATLSTRAAVGNQRLTAWAMARPFQPAFLILLYLITFILGKLYKLWSSWLCNFLHFMILQFYGPDILLITDHDLYDNLNKQLNIVTIRDYTRSESVLSGRLTFDYWILTWRVEATSSHPKYSDHYWVHCASPVYKDS
jgi:hypothetical protein